MVHDRPVGRDLRHDDQGNGRAFGHARANIRYYEQKGLIAPKRMGNGYRDYGEEDVRTLERVKLLHALGCSVEEIRQMKDGSRGPADILGERAFEREMETAGQEREICGAICTGGAKFFDLDAKKNFSGAWKDTGLAKPIEPPKEEAPKPGLWRRFWARMLDVQIYTGIWSAILCFAWLASQCSENSLWTLAGIAAGDIIMIALEPLLHFFGTTPGKWALGLRVRAGGDLYRAAAGYRVCAHLLHGAWTHACVPRDALAAGICRKLQPHDVGIWRRPEDTALLRGDRPEGDGKP